ncbi:MAG: site-specific DNA-methyltransferase [Syntrophales bacterium]
MYPDDYSENLDTYLRYTGQIDNEGRKYSTNTEADGRFHSKWMNMMYPRLFLARNLLRNDGVIFISIDDTEASNLRQQLDELFGTENFLGCISVVSNWKGRSDDKHFATAHNFLFVYSRGSFQTQGVPIPEEYWDDYPHVDSKGKRYRLIGLRKRGAGARREDRPNMYFPIYVDPQTCNVSLEMSQKFSIEVLPRLADGVDGRWRWGIDTVRDRCEELTASQVGRNDRWDVFQIDYSENEQGLKRIKPKTFWMGAEFSNEAGTLEVKKLMGKGIFDTPKPTTLIRYMCEQALKEGEIILDFFCGSSTTAHAVLDMNREDKVNRKFIMVQLPEPTDENSEAHKAGYKTIADIGKERIRRVIVKIKDEREKIIDLFSDDKPQLDLGFKVFKLRPSNFKLWDGDVAKDEEAIEKQIELFVEHINPQSSQEDILYEILLKSGFPLTTKIEKTVLAERDVFRIADGSMLICLENDLTLEVIKAMAEIKPVRVVCLDEGFKGNDQLKTNAVQIMKTRNITFRTV